MSRPVYVELDLQALRHNVQRIREIAPHSKLLAMVKANAYGHGLKTIAQTLASEVDGFGVSCSEEAIYLRHAKINQRIVLMEGLFSNAEVDLLDRYQLDTVVHDQRQLQFLTQRSLQHIVNVWIKINTGMNRLGLSLDEFCLVWDKLKACPWINVVCVMSHFSNADKKDTCTHEQIKRFEQVTKGLNVEKSLSNSAAILSCPASHLDWVRPGLMLYGVSPFSNQSGIQHGLKPVMNLKSEIIAINQLKPGDSVGYGGTWIASKPMTLGVVAIGYGDGYPHQATNGTPILINNKLAELAGQVSMDMLTIDLSQHPNTQMGDPVLLWGANLPIEQVAMSTGTFRYELLCGINRGRLLRAQIERKKNVKDY